MAYGASPHDAALKAAWASFCDRAKAAGELLFKDVNPATPTHRAAAFRYLSQNLGQAFDFALETWDTQYPALHVFDSPTRKFGSENADGIYMQAWIDGRSVYRLSGRKGTARMLNIAVHDGPPSVSAYGAAMSRPLHDPFGDTPSANIFSHEIKTNWDNSFELYIGGERQGQNWVPTTRNTRKLFLRQFFDSWDEEPASFRIERVGMDSPRPMPTPEQMIAAMKWAEDYVFNCAKEWPDWLWEAGDQLDVNAINQFAGPNLKDDKPWTAETETIDKRRGRLVTMMRWGFETDEALIIEFDAYDGFWMFTNEGVFGDAMDHQYRPISFTPSRTAVDSDGKIRLVMAASDPGYANWLDNQGFTAGVLTFRNIHSRKAPRFRTQLVKAADLAAHMPADARMSSREQRIAEMWARFNAIRRRFPV
jgi:hypothetical protein